MKVTPVVLRASRAPLAVDCHNPSVHATLDGHGIAVNDLVLGSSGSRVTPNKLQLHTTTLEEKQQDARGNNGESQDKL